MTITSGVSSCPNRPVIMPDVDISRLPAEIREKLAELDLELSEGEITQKGYDKKKNLLLTPYLQSAKCVHAQASPGTRAHRRHQRKLTRDEGRFHSEIRAEAVQQALAEYSQGKKEKPGILQPIKRTAADFREQSSRISGNILTAETTPTNGSGNAVLPLPPDVTGGAAVEAMLRKVREQHEKNMQLRQTSVDKQADKRSTPKEYRNSKAYNEEDARIFNQDTTAIEDAVYVNQIPTRDENTNQDYQNAVLRKYIHK
uniref:DMAP-interaction domain-containing protein n=1 Tax=Heterorhabditis bacteriophora TaxID=37862 RepID=A0A1I7XEI9_HETBA